ncbi:DUF6328 family protein [Streptomyces sp. NPDC093252]|uniref:DUF6328 family protein n=1 Tax=Streptomyces sp. NPDC093252 TaxID=3154980 RepID=UPI0034157B8C
MLKTASRAAPPPLVVGSRDHDPEHGDRPVPAPKSGRKAKERERARLTAAYAELLQEIRVAQTGVQVLLAFLLTLAFTPRFAIITPMQRYLYVADLLLTSVAASLLIAPAPFHRLVHGRELRKQLLDTSAKLAFWGLIALMLAMVTSLLLILDVVLGLHLATCLAGITLTWFAVFWCGLPYWSRRRARPRAAPAPQVKIPRQSPRNTVDEVPARHSA